MPELWLPYGALEVAVDLKEENILKVAQVDLQPVSPDELREAASSLATGEGTILVLTDSDTVAELLSMASKGWRVIAPRRIQSRVKRWADSSGLKLSPFTTETVKMDGLDLPLPRGPKPHVIIGEARFDPLFGVEGPVAQLLRGSKGALSGLLKILEGGPLVGLETEAWKLADEVAEKFTQIRAIELVEVGSKVAHVAYGPVAEAHRKAGSFLTSSSLVNVEGGGRLGLVSSGGGRWDASLWGALRALWNVVGGIRRDGRIVLVAECSEGLGAPALEERVYGQRTRTSGYLEGLEDVLLLEWVKEKFGIILVCSLPQTWVEGKLGLKAGPSATKALSEVMSARSRVLVVPRAGNMLLKS